MEVGWRSRAGGIRDSGKGGVGMGGGAGAGGVWRRVVVGAARRPVWVVHGLSVLFSYLILSCPPPVLADPGASCSLSLGPRVPWCARPAHGCSRSGWHAACPSTCPAPPRSRFGGADYELLERVRHGTLGPSNSEATLLQLGRPALRMSSKHEVVFIFTPHDGSE